MINKTLAEWLSSPSGRTNKNTICYLAELIAVNGGSIEVTKIGNIVPNKTVWKRAGLNPQEAIDLVRLSSFLKGMFYVLENQELEHEVFQLIQREIEKMERGSKLVIPTLSEQKVFGKER